MAPDGKEDERKARRRSPKLRRGRFAKSDTASRMPGRATPLAGRVGGTGGRERRAVGGSDAEPPARKTAAAGAFPGQVPRAMASRLISPAKHPHPTVGTVAAEPLAVPPVLGRGEEHG
jgi:hypothetical protein